MTLATLKAAKFVEKVMLSGNVMYLKELATCRDGKQSKQNELHFCYFSEN